MSNEKIKLDKSSAAKLQWLDEEMTRHFKEMAKIAAQAAIKNDPTKKEVFSKDPVYYRYPVSSTRLPKTVIICWGSGEGMGLLVDTEIGYQEPYDGCH